VAANAAINIDAAEPVELVLVVGDAVAEDHVTT